MYGRRGRLVPIFLSLGILLLSLVVNGKRLTPYLLSNVGNLYLTTGLMQGNNHAFVQRAEVVLALSSPNEAAKIGHDNPPAAYTHGLALILLERIDDSVSRLSDTTQFNHDLLYLQGKRYQRAENNHIARNFFAVLTSLEPQEPRGWIEIASLDYAARNTDGFKRATDQLMIIDPIPTDTRMGFTQSLWRRYWLAERFRLDGQFEESVAMLQDVLEDDSQFPYAILSIGESLYLAQNCEAAMPFLEQAMDMLDDPYWPTHFLAICHQQIDQGSPAAGYDPQMQNHEPRLLPGLKTWDEAEVFWLPRDTLVKQFELLEEVSIVNGNGPNGRTK